MSTVTPRIELGADEIHLWCAFHAEISDGALLGDYERLLAPDERRQRSRFVFASDRHRYLITRALVRTTLSRYVAVSPTELTFRTNAFGRPEIANAQAPAQRLVFNISHSSDLTILAVGQQRALGVDTENVRTRQVPFEIASRFFAPDEVAALQALPLDQQGRRFLEYWTLKESYVKAREKGLSIPLDTFGFRFCGDHRLAFRVDPDQNDDPSRWHFWQFDLADDDVAAVCAQRTRRDAPRLVLTKIVPLASEHELQPGQLRTTDAPQSGAAGAPSVTPTC
jgi:4'-phosphopantetheinyl transferase